LNPSVVLQARTQVEFTHFPAPWLLAGGAQSASTQHRESGIAVPFGQRRHPAFAVETQAPFTQLAVEHSVAAPHTTAAPHEPVALQMLPQLGPQELPGVANVTVHELVPLQVRFVHPPLTQLTAVPPQWPAPSQ
jgi:hypothetical protein